MSLVHTTLDLLSHTCTLDSQTMLDPLCKLVFGALGRLRQQLLNAVLPRQLHKLRLPTVGVDGILPLASDWVFVEDERVRTLLLVARGCRALGDQGGWWPACEEALKRSG